MSEDLQGVKGHSAASVSKRDAQPMIRQRMWGASNGSVTVRSCLLLRVGKDREAGETSEQREVALRHPGGATGCLQGCRGKEILALAKAWREDPTQFPKQLL